MMAMVHGDDAAGAAGGAAGLGFGEGDD